MKKEILESLYKLEQEKNIEILFACESGSRAWGFHSPDSDYDVRFVYVHKKDWYLSIEDRKDFIEFPKDEILDIVGYDLRKMLKLFRSSNAKIFEWIQSPVMYKRDDAFVNNIKALFDEYFSAKAGLHHYLGLTRNTFENYLQTERIKLKKYFYALRPVLAANWIVKHNTCPPMEFAALREMVNNEQVSKRIDLLLEQKAGVGEGFEISPDPLLHHFIQEQMAAAEAHAKQLEPRRVPAHQLNLLFQQTTGLYDHSGT